MSRTIPNLVIAGALALGTSGCNFFSSFGGGSGMAFAVDMEKYEVDSIDLEIAGTEGTFCPSQGASFTVIASAKKKKTGESVKLLTAAADAKASDVRGKMDLTEFAMEARGATVERGVFTTSADHWQTLHGFDIRATYRNDKTKVVEKHFDPVYSCMMNAGGFGASGNEGEGGYPGQEAGQGGGAAGAGGPGGPGPQITAYITVVRTPKHSHVGLVKVEGDYQQQALFDLKTGITVIAAGGQGGPGGRGGDGAEGADPQGPGGPGGPGGEGGPGGQGGEAIVVLDDRYPELAGIVRIDVGGGAPGNGGDGGYGGAGGPAPEKACDDCDEPEPGPDGVQGVGGPAGSIAGRDGRAEVRNADLTSVFATLPPGVRLRDDPRPQPAPPPAPTGKKRRR